MSRMVGGSTQTSIIGAPVFTLSAFLGSPGFVGTVAIFAFPLLAFVGLNLALIVWRRVYSELWPL